jgi:biopolymer transport protein ExbB/TolQ
MSPIQARDGDERGGSPRRRSFSTLAAFVFGVPATVAVLALVHAGPLRDTEVARYLSHPVEAVEVLLFCCALGALLAKVAASWRERAAFRGEVLPPWDGKPVPAEDAGALLAAARRHGRGWQATCLGRRVTAVLDFVSSRASANDLDDQLRTLADNDFMAFETSYALTRFITWAIPILGFLGTVLGITGAIAGITPEILERSLNTVTDGLALAFDATAVALALTMVTMFVTFLVERLEEGVLHQVDQYVDEHLSHRFERSGAEGGGVGEDLRRQTQVLISATEKLVQGQADVWAKTMAEAQRQWSGTGRKQQEAVTAALEQALERTLQSHARRLAELEERNAKQSAVLLDRLTELARGMNAQVEALARLDAGAGQLLRLEEVLSHNLEALAGAGAFEQAVSSLTAAIHLLTTRLGSAPASTAPGRFGAKPGAAA